MFTANTFETPSKADHTCKDCKSCRCNDGDRWKRTASKFTDPETAGTLEAALTSQWPPEEFPVSIEVLGDEGGVNPVVKIHGVGINLQEMVAVEPSLIWHPGRVIAVILTETQRIIQWLKDEGRLS